MDTDDTASREQEIVHESDTALKDIRVLFKDSLDKPIIRCWNEAEIWYSYTLHIQQYAFKYEANNIQARSFTTTMRRCNLSALKIPLELGTLPHSTDVCLLDYLPISRHFWKVDLAKARKKFSRSILTQTSCAHSSNGCPPAKSLLTVDLKSE